MAQVLGMFAAVLGIIQFGINNLPEPETQKTKVRIGVGLDVGGGLSEAGGNVPDVWLWNEGGEFLGMEEDPGDVEDGSFYDVSVDQGDNGQQAPYILLSGNDDAVCIAYVSTTWADGSKFGWLGDWGKECGGPWYYSNIYWKNEDYKPMCTWVDKNGDQPQTGISMHIPSFNTKKDKVPKHVSTDTFCGDWAKFQLHTEYDPSHVNFIPIVNPPPRLGRRTQDNGAVAVAPKSKKPAVPSKIPSGEHRRTNHADTLVMSQDAHHHATERLCSSPTSAGPDFVNVAEGQFCNMSDKTLWPLCDKEKHTDNCFNMETQQLVVNGVSARGGKKYKKVKQWA